jgi:hypothetical protein
MWAARGRGRSLSQFPWCRLGSRHFSLRICGRIDKEVVSFHDILEEHYECIQHVFGIYQECITMGFSQLIRIQSPGAGGDAGTVVGALDVGLQIARVGVRRLD